MNNQTRPEYIPEPIWIQMDEATRNAIIEKDQPKKKSKAKPEPEIEYYEHEPVEEESGKYSFTHYCDFVEVMKKPDNIDNVFKFAYQNNMNFDEEFFIKAVGKRACFRKELEGKIGRKSYGKAFARIHPEYRCCHNKKRVGRCLMMVEHESGICKTCKYDFKGCENLYNKNVDMDRLKFDFKKFKKEYSDEKVLELCLEGNVDSKAQKIDDAFNGMFNEVVQEKPIEKLVEEEKAVEKKRVILEKPVEKPVEKSIEEIEFKPDFDEFKARNEYLDDIEKSKALLKKKAFNIPKGKHLGLNVSNHEFVYYETDDEVQAKAGKNDNDIKIKGETYFREWYLFSKGGKNTFGEQLFKLYKNLN